MGYALTVGKDFAAACKDGACGQIHSIFERAINLEILGKNHLLTILYEGDRLDSVKAGTLNADIMPASCIVSAPCQGSIDDKVLLTHDVFI